MNRITSLLGIQYPIIQGGMVWCSGWRLASAVSNAGGLGLIGAGSMHPDTLREHIRKCNAATKFPFGVNIPLMYPQIEEIMNIVVEEGVKIVFTSAGNPKTWTGWLKERGITVAHVVSSSTTMFMISSICGYINGIFTPKGLSVAARHLRICSRKTSGYIEPEPISPRPPALLTAEASFQPLHHTIPP